MNYVPIHRTRDSSSPSPSPAPFHNSSTLYINQQPPILHLPRPRFNVTVNGHLHPQHRTHDFSRITIRTPDMRTRRPLMPFQTTVSPSRTGDRASSALNDVQRKLAALTLRLEKELESETTVDEYYGQCTKCNQSVTGPSEACQAMGELYHNDCFKCVVCARTLRGKAFYRVHDQVYCEEDYLVRKFLLIVDWTCWLCHSVHWLSANGRKVSHLWTSDHGQGKIDLERPKTEMGMVHSRCSKHSAIPIIRAVSVVQSAMNLSMVCRSPWTKNGVCSVYMTITSTICVIWG